MGLNEVERFTQLQVLKTFPVLNVGNIANEDITSQWHFEVRCLSLDAAPNAASKCVFRICNGHVV